MPLSPGFVVLGLLLDLFECKGRERERERESKGKGPLLLVFIFHGMEFMPNRTYKVDGS